MCHQYVSFHYDIIIVKLQQEPPQSTDICSSCAYNKLHLGNHNLYSFMYMVDLSDLHRKSFLHKSQVQGCMAEKHDCTPKA